MLARSSTLIHPSGQKLQTPLLVSSFSSKGFKFIHRKGKERSEAYEYLKMTSDALTDSVLISAYDIKYYYPSINKFRSEGFFPQFVFVDSGGYETLDDFDFSEAYKYPVKINAWDLESYEEILFKWPKFYDGIFVSYDHGSERRLSFSKQVKRAEKLFNKFPNQLHDFLIKPDRKGIKLDIDNIVKNVQLLSTFNIIGIAEKEIGESLIDRLLSVKRIREALDSAGISAPLHLFGNLDPVTSIMYFLAGIEIFDGLTWLRFTFYKGKAIYDQNMAAIRRRIESNDTLYKKMSLVENVLYLKNLQSEMRSFLRKIKEGNKAEAFKCFSFYSNEIENAFTILNSKTV
jgi:hypothetical protein